MANVRRPEHKAPPEIVSFDHFLNPYPIHIVTDLSFDFQFYNDDEAQKYSQK